MAGSAGHIPEGGHVFVEIQETAEYPDGVISGALKYRRVTFPLGIARNRRRQCLPLREIAIEDGLNFAPDPKQLRLQIGRQNGRRHGTRQRRIRVVGWDGLVHLGLRGRGVGNAQDPERHCQACCYNSRCVLGHRLPPSAFSGSR
jgi:hypothetical protein